MKGILHIKHSVRKSVKGFTNSMTTEQIQFYFLQKLIKYLWPSIIGDFRKNYANITEKNTSSRI